MVTDITDSNSAYLKASAYEPNKILDKPTELVYHMDGQLYFDWSRKQLADVTDKKEDIEQFFDGAFAGRRLKVKEKLPSKGKPVVNANFNKDIFDEDEDSIATSKKTNKGKTAKVVKLPAKATAVKQKRKKSDGSKCSYKSNCHY
jgi:hypothetical protein